MDQGELFLLGVIGDAPSPLNDVELDRAWHDLRDQLSRQDLRQAKRAAAVTGLIEHGTDGRWRLTGAGRRVIGRAPAVRKSSGVPSGMDTASGDQPEPLPKTHHPARRRTVPDLH